MTRLKGGLQAKYVRRALVVAIMVGLALSPINQPEAMGIDTMSRFTAVANAADERRAEREKARKAELSTRT